MKGRTSNTQRTNSMKAYATGGAVSAAPSGSSAPVARRDGGSCTVDGKAAKPSLARAMRKRADGGRISEDSKREAKKLRAEDAGRVSGWLIPGGVGGGLLAAGGPRTRLLGAGLAGYGTAKITDHFTRDQREGDPLKEADRIERGLAEPGREDRKDGGKVEKKDWIAGATKNKGGLHRALKVPMGQKIPAAKIDKAAHSDNPTLAKQANLAKTLKGFNK